MSSFAQPTIAPNSRVTAPTNTTASRASADRSYSGPDRTIRYTPAVTMVAAWISADTGVGPSIASNNQAWIGTWADLAQAPTNISSPITVVIAVGPVSRAAANTPSNCRVPKLAKMANMASANPTSPTRLDTNAFLPAVAAEGR
ncbi:hypothetical protein C1Y40_02953 [Mycobacterium talmoniae]|uniref:Uncharacterized protein n=1 Tax=Mycobacterium talmoniae TaxID=1858794 RepID=A0A2S8BJM1_9MYCO|nr:hypothetical protein C1Y40_02953 [Mycobacterium talmoniae]